MQARCGPPKEAQSSQDDEVRFHHAARSSLHLSRMVREQGTTLAEKFALPASRYAAAGGAVPLRVTGAGVVGWMGASGLPQVEDHRFVVRVLLEHLGVDHLGDGGSSA